jgi:hypothetical protein
MKNCTHCTNGMSCESKSDDHYHCTREQGHSGPHVACGWEHGLATWPSSESICKNCGQPTHSNDHICFVCWDKFRASGIDTEAQSAATSNGPEPKAVPTRVPDAPSYSVAKKYAKLFAEKLAEVAIMENWIEYINLCEQAAHIGRVALLESQADEMGIVKG